MMGEKGRQSSFVFAVTFLFMHQQNDSIKNLTTAVE
jgi:hypothetical protein